MNKHPALHSAAPKGCVCSDCGIDEEPCPVCYRVWWQARHPNTNIIMANDSEVFAANQRATTAEAALALATGRALEEAAKVCMKIAPDGHVHEEDFTAGKREGCFECESAIRQLAFGK